MALDLNFLVNILDKDLLAYQQLLAVTKQEQAAIIQNKPLIIDTCVNKKNQLFSAIEKIETIKQKILFNIAQEFNINKKLTSFNDVADLLGDIYKDKITKYLKKLKNVLLELKAVNLNNGKLLNYSLHFISYMVTNFTTVNETKCTYNASGVYHKPNRISNIEYCF